MRGGCKEFSLRRFVLNGPEVLKIKFSYRQWTDIHTKKQPKWSSAAVSCTCVAPCVSSGNAGHAASTAASAALAPVAPEVKKSI